MASLHWRMKTAMRLGAEVQTRRLACPRRIRGCGLERPAHAKRFSLRSVFLILGVVVFLLGSGCGWRKPRLMESHYGELQGSGAKRWPDGVDVLAEMFRDHGFTVRRWRRLSPKLMGKQRRADEADREKAYRVIVWAPESLSELSVEQYDFLGEFVEEGGTLILIGRDFDPVREYWRKTLTQYDSEQYPFALRQAMLHEARVEWLLARELPCRTPWCTIEIQPGEPQVRRLDGPWAVGLEFERPDLQVATRMVPLHLADQDEDAEESGEPKSEGEKAKSPAGQTGDLEADDEVSAVQHWPVDAPSILSHPQSEVLLDSDRGPLVLRVVGDGSSFSEFADVLEDSDWQELVEELQGQVLFCLNGSFLLNLGMVPEGNRELARVLVEQCGEAGQVAVIDPNPGRVRVWNTEPEGRHIPPRSEPVSTILDHVAVLGVALCFAFFPIFGRPKRHPQPPASDFGEHIDAVAVLMAKTRDTEYARRQVDAYHQLVQRSVIRQPAPP